MQKDRDEQHYDHEESEYHFSDDDVSYEVETDASKPAAPEPEKKNPIAGLSSSKRMLISLVVFLGLVFVVYKMVSPGTSAPSTDIAPVTAQATVPVPDVAPPAIPHTQAEAPTQPAAQPTAPAQPAVVPTQAVAPTPTAAPATTTTTVVTTTAPTSPAPAAAPQVAQAQPQTTQPMTAQPPAPPSAVPPAPISATPPAMAAAQPTAMSPPTTVPVNAVPPTGQMPVATTVVTTSPVTPGSTDAAIAAMAAANEKIMNQLQADYSQKVNDFTNQNKALQDQMQTLSSRVAGLESQLNQLVQTLTRQTGMGGTTSLNVVPAQQPAPPSVEQRIHYSVQAIIPGRAWLKSDNGETLTVAEGDTIKELGRVSKIDPYDGVVEVNTGNRTVSISYGSGG